MMATTHALAGVLVGLLALRVAPGAGWGLLLAGGLGGLFPDLDLFGAHRRTLHFPVYYPLAAGVAVAAAVLTGAPLAVGAAVFLLAAGLHAVTDVLGGGLELRPWEATSDRGVYEHFRGRWHPPRRLVRYDGAPEDLLLAVALAVPSLVVLEGPARTAVAGLLAVSAAYALVRRRLVAVGEWLVEVLPEAVVEALPDAVFGDVR